MFVGNQINAPMGKLVQPIMTHHISRGVKNIVRLAKMIPDEQIHESDNHKQDVIEFKDALLWLERYTNWHKQR